jgi:hypothetical protein
MHVSAVQGVDRETPALRRPMMHKVVQWRSGERPM